MLPHPLASPATISRADFPVLVLTVFGGFSLLFLTSLVLSAAFERSIRPALNRRVMYRALIMFSGLYMVGVWTDLVAVVEALPVAIGVYWAMHAHCLVPGLTPQVTDGTRPADQLRPVRRDDVRDRR